MLKLPPWQRLWVNDYDGCTKYLPALTTKNTGGSTCKLFIASKIKVQRPKKSFLSCESQPDLMISKLNYLVAVENVYV